LLFAVILFMLFNWQPMLKAPAHVSAKEKQLALKNYNWLRTSSLLTIPTCVLLMIFFEVNGSYRYRVHYAVAAAVLPWFWHIGVIARLRIKNLYVFRQTQQALLLLILRSASVAFALANIDYGGLWWFVVVNGALWIFGGNWYHRQIKNNTCWLMTDNREEIILGDDLLTTNAVKPTPMREAASSTMAQVYLDEGLKLFAKDNDKKAATKKLLLAFQAGTPEIRQRAVAALDKLGEVEMF
jgi:hypothetical protein